MSPQTCRKRGTTRRNRGAAIQSASQDKEDHRMLLIYPQPGHICAEIMTLYNNNKIIIMKASCGIKDNDPGLNKQMDNNVCTLLIV